MYRYFLTLFFVAFILNGCEKAEEISQNQKAITKISDGYKLAVPSEIAQEVEERKNVKLTLSNPEKGDVSVQGHLVRTSGGLILKTRESLDLPPNVSSFSIVLHEPNTPAQSCSAAEFGIGCYFAAPCAGTRYCLPGSGPGGFTCRCI